MKTLDQQLLEEAYEETELNSTINSLFKQLGLRGEDYKEEFLKARFRKWAKMDSFIKKELESDLQTLLSSLSRK